MFSAPRNTVDLAEALNAGKIILVSTEVNYLRDLSPLFGRYIISRVVSAALERAEVPRAQRRQAYLLIDECKPYVDHKIEQILTTMREYGLGVTMAFQDVGQMAPYTGTVISNTAIKLVSTISQDDARALAGDMEAAPEFLRGHKKQGGDNAKSATFACYTRDLGRSITIELPFLKLDTYPMMSEADYRRLRRANQNRLQGLATADSPAFSLEEHFAVVGLLWGLFEQAIKRNGGQAENGTLDIDRVGSKLNAAEKSIAHTIRIQRNQLSHIKRVPIPDLVWWEDECRNLIGVLSPETPQPPPIIRTSRRGSQPPPPPPDDPDDIDNIDVTRGRKK